MVDDHDAPPHERCPACGQTIPESSHVDDDEAERLADLRARMAGAPTAGDATPHVEPDAPTERIDAPRRLVLGDAWHGGAPIAPVMVADAFDAAVTDEVVIELQHNQLAWHPGTGGMSFVGPAQILYRRDEDGTHATRLA